MAKAIGYVRVSTEEQVREGVSLDNQKARIESYCKYTRMSRNIHKGYCLADSELG